MIHPGDLVKGTGGARIWHEHGLGPLRGQVPPDGSMGLVVGHGASGEAWDGWLIVWTEGVVGWTSGRHLREAY